MPGGPGVEGARVPGCLGARVPGGPAFEGARGPGGQGARRAEQKAFDDAAARDAVAEQAGREDARVVDDEEIAGAEKCRQIPNGGVME